VAQAAFDAAVKYAKQREQFGQKISKFQGLRWIIADMATEIEAARQLVLSAAAMKDRKGALHHPGLHGQAVCLRNGQSGHGQGPADARRLRVYHRLPVERFYRDARVFTIYEGTSEIQRVVISNNILKDKRTPN
jgi:butyryl-CoA dehydrogenase